MEDFIVAAVKVLIAFVFLFGVVILLIWAERRLLAFMQNRLGPTRAGPFGILQTLADGIKLMFKESMTPDRADVVLYLAAPVMALLPALMIFLVIPIGAPITIGDTTYTLQVTDLNVGVLYILALSSMAVYAITFAGWSSGSKYPLLGSVRASAQMISYEAAMGLAIVPVIMYTGTTSVAGIVEAQGGTYFGFLPAWNIVLLPSFVVFLIAAFAETNRAPFDLVEAEQEIVGGFHTEYSGFVLPRRVHQPVHHVGTHRHAVLRWVAGSRLRTHLPPVSASGRLVPAQDLPDRVPVHLGTGHVPQDALRPADGIRMEAPHSDFAGLDHPRDGGDRYSTIRVAMGMREVLR